MPPNRLFTYFCSSCKRTTYLTYLDFTLTCPYCKSGLLEPIDEEIIQEEPDEIL